MTKVIWEIRRKTQMHISLKIEGGIMAHHFSEIHSATTTFYCDYFK